MEKRTKVPKRLRHLELIAFLESNNHSWYHSSVLEKKFNVSGYRLRIMINKSRMQGIPIASNLDKGYKYANSRAELNDTIEWFERKAKQHLKMAKSLKLINFKTKPNIPGELFERIGKPEMKTYWSGWYKDPTFKLVLQVVDEIDCMSCEILSEGFQRFEYEDQGERMRSEAFKKHVLSKYNNHRFMKSSFAMEWNLDFYYMEYKDNVDDWHPLT